MSDLSKLSDEELLKALNSQSSGKISPMAGISDAELLAMLKKPERSIGEKAARLAVMPAQGFNESLATTLGALPDAVAAGMRAVGIPTSKPGQYTDWARRGIRAITGEPTQPETRAEEVLQAAGKGVGDAASMFVPATAAARATKAGTMAHHVAQALASQPGTQALAGAVGHGTTEATGSPAAGLVAALATPTAMNVARRVVTPAPIPEARRPIVDIAEREGVPLTVGQRSDSPPMRWADTVFRNYPTTANRQAAIEDATRIGFNRAALSKAGIRADLATPGVMEGAAQEFGRRFEDLSRRVTVSLDNKLLSDMQKVLTRYGRKLPSQQRPAFQAYVDDILNSGNTMPGPAYQVARSDLTRQARSAAQSDPFFGEALRGLRDALDDAASRSMPAHLSDSWRQLRREYANFKVLEKAVSGAGERVAEGYISPAALRMAINMQSKRNYALGRGDLSELARLGQVVKDLPQSGTSPQANLTNLMTGLGAGGISAGAGATMGYDPLTSAAVALAGPYAAQRIYQSPPVQAYLRNQLAGASVPLQPGAATSIMAASPLVRQLLADELIRPSGQR